MKNQDKIKITVLEQIPVSKNSGLTTKKLADTTTFSCASCKKFEKCKNSFACSLLNNLDEVLLPLIIKNTIDPTFVTILENKNGIRSRSYTVDSPEKKAYFTNTIYEKIKEYHTR